MKTAHAFTVSVRCVWCLDRAVFDPFAQSMIWIANIHVLLVTRNKDQSKDSLSKLSSQLTLLYRRISQARQLRRIESPQEHVSEWPINNYETVSLNDLPTRRPRLGAVVQSQRQRAAASTTNENSNTSPRGTPGNTASDVMSTNPHTGNLEFYGSSSSVAFIRHVETLSRSSTTGLDVRRSERSLMSLLQDAEFQPGKSRSMPALQASEQNTDRFYFRFARRFLDAYFSNIHSIHPLFEEEVFLNRCEDLWFERPGKPSLSFLALYYAVLSIGSLVMAASESLETSGADRFAWSRTLFQEAQTIITELGTATDLEMVQCFYVMTKICQHELNPHIAYLYSGQATRIALAIGINRKPISPGAADPRNLMAASQTWWAVYCLDIQTSFALGRPESLGPDEYHTQRLPLEALEDPSLSPHILQVVPCMIELSRITRQVALDLYTRQWEMEEKLHRAKTLDAELEQWLQQLPLHLRFEPQNGSDNLLKPSRRANYIKKQSVVLKLRYLNLRMLIHAVFMTHVETTRSDGSTCLRKCQCQCMKTAEDTIDLMYETFRKDDFFQTWWYNATYTLFAVSTLLAAVFHRLPRTQQGLESHFAHIDRAVEGLQAMDECLVVRNAIVIVKRTLARSRGLQ